MGTEHPALAPARAGRLDDALRLLPADGPLPVAVAWRVGVLLHARGKFDAAARIYERADDGGQISGAAERERVRAGDPSSGAELADQAQLLAGRAYLNSAQLQRAEEAFSRVIEIDPADHYARFALGKALHRQGRLSEAHAQLKMAAAMDPRPEYQEALGEVRARMAVRADNPDELPGA